MESWMMANGKYGATFYSVKLDRHLTSIASHHNRRITTERLVLITTAKSNPIASRLTKVTLL